MLDLRNLRRCPVTSGTLAISCVVSVAFWGGWSIEPIQMTYVPLARQPWTPFTSVFPHVNILHLLFNGYWLWLFGTWFERRYGWGRTVGCFALWAAGAALAEFAFLDGGIGLSGVVYALWAFFSVLRRRFYLSNGPVGQREDQLFVAWFFLCVVLTYSDIMAIGNLAHAGGAALGALSAMTVCSNRKLWAMATAGLMVALVVASTTLRPRLCVSTYYTEGLVYEASQLVQKELWPEAEAKLRTVLQRIPDDGEEWAVLGLVLVELEREAEAGEAYERAYELSPGNAYVLRSVAWWHDRLAGQSIGARDYRTARDHYLLACNLQPRRARYRRGLAEMHDILKDVEAARESYEILLELDPDDQNARAWLDELGK